MKIDSFEQLYRLILDILPDAIFFEDAHGELCVATGHALVGKDMLETCFSTTNAAMVPELFRNEDDSG
jgi:hypothetical protein